jgi:hypothetical protein
VLDDGRRVPAACLNSAAYREFVKKWADWVLECGVDAVFWDEPAWVVRSTWESTMTRAGRAGDRCAELFGGPIPAEPTAEVERFRTESVVDFLRGLVAHVAARGGASTVCLLPATKGRQGLADWDEVAALPGLATLATDPYWKQWDEAAEPFVRRFARLLCGTAARHGVGAQLWVPSFGVGLEDLPDLETAIAVAREEGVEDLWTWGYEACRHMTHLAASGSAAVWEAVSAGLVRSKVRA